MQCSRALCQSLLVPSWVGRRTTETRRRSLLGRRTGKLVLMHSLEAAAPADVVLLPQGCDAQVQVLPHTAVSLTCPAEVAASR